MEKAPVSMRKYIGIFGNTNSGKSSLFNAIIGQDMAVVSDVSGTTTDPVSKAVELIGYGPVTLVDTPGINDFSILGEKRVNKTKDILSRCDLAIYLQDASNLQNSSFDFGNTPHINVFSKCNLVDKDVIAKLKEEHKDALFLNQYTDDEIALLKSIIIKKLKEQSADDETLLGDIINPGETVVLVIPIDSAAPKGRLILPQVQTIRDCLDNGIRAVSVSPDCLRQTLIDFPKTALVITDSQIFGKVSEIVPDDIPLTSFSMLLANQKGNFSQLVEGTEVIKDLKDGDEILVLEACTHSTTHEDIGKVKIPQLLQMKTGKKLNFTHLSGFDFPDDINKYKLVIQCGGCMINKRTICNRLLRFSQENIPVTNYGVVLAYLNGILDRAKMIFIKNNI